MFPDCSKRQRELYKGDERHRCIHPEAETKGQFVTEHVCEQCPLVVLKIKSCKEKQKEAREARVAFATERSLPVIDQGFPMCPYRYSDKEGKRCSITGLGVDVETCNRCNELTMVEEKNNQASFGNKVVNYFGAVRRWVASGRPTRTPEEIKRLFEEHCSKCEMYDKKKHACKSCGCSIASEGDPLGNKLAMKTEHCPLGRW